MQTARTLSNAGGNANRALHALFHRWLDAAEPRLARFVHEQADPKPFTLSPLREDGDGRYHFRLTLLEEEYWGYVSEGMKRERTVRVGDEILALDGQLQAEQRAYAEIAAAQSTDTEIVLRFDSPTSFKSREMLNPLPDARSVFQSHLVRWNAFASEPLEPQEVFLDWVMNHVAVSKFDLRTEVLGFGRHLQIGCVGEAHYRVAERMDGDAELVCWLNRLADYAYFCGTGHKTTQGMGQTRRLLSANRRESERMEKEKIGED